MTRDASDRKRQRYQKASGKAAASEKQWILLQHLESAVMEFLVDDVDNREFLSKLVRSMRGELPEKKKKRLTEAE